MTVSEEIWTKNHSSLFLRGEPFYPLIGTESDSWSNAVMIDLPASLQADFNWDCAISLAHKVIAKGKWIVWNLDLALASVTFLPDDTATFHSLWLSFEQFCKKILPLFEKQTLGVIVYQGKLDITPLFPRNWWESHFLENLHEKKSYLFFCIELFSEYIHRLVSILPDTIFPFIFFDTSEYQQLSLIAHLLFHERFEHVILGIKGNYPFATIGWETPYGTLGYYGNTPPPCQNQERGRSAILLPEDPFWTAPFCQAFDATSAYLQKEGKEFCLISVKKLHEEWDEIDAIYIPTKDAISEQTRRKLQGFEATGGVVIIGEKS